MLDTSKCLITKHSKTKGKDYLLPTFFHYKKFLKPRFGENIAKTIVQTTYTYNCITITFIYFCGGETYEYCNS